MQYLKRLTLILSLLFVVLSCENRNNQTEKDYFIEWDKSSLVCIAEEGAYPRLIRLSNDSLLAVYENRVGDVVLKKSGDDGSTWSDEIHAFKAFNYNDETKVNIANPEIIQLPNGDLLLAVNLRPRIEGVYPFSIALKRSFDAGETWSEANILYQASTFFKDGCWEPSFLILPDESIHIYFANEYPYQQSDEQEISVIKSIDNGFTWTNEPQTVSFRNGHRDGMPIAVHDNEMIYVVIEDNISGQFKPWIISGSIENSWGKPVYSDSPDRYSALKHKLPNTVYAGAPYMIKTDNDVYLISYQTTENRTSNWEHSTMEVVVSDKHFEFINPSQPFKVPLHKEAKWNSIADLGNNTIAALSTTNFNSQKVGIWMIKGVVSERTSNQ